LPAADIITEKLIKMKKYLEELNSIKPADFNSYTQNLTTRYAVERLLQLIVDLALDINNIILSQKGKPAAVDYFSSFLDLADCGVLTPEFAIQIAPSTGLRNRLVHEYEEVNNKIVYNSIDKTINIYGRYIMEIKKLLKN
jgi:uncharacterized protein YutE (UPF0331/DUF86 family)